MTQEEKARAYDEAIERAKNFIENGDESERTIAESIFAGIMEESEDERIRKDIVFYIAAHHKDDGEKARWLYWLEKQGEQKQKQYDIDVLEKHITKDSISELAHTVIVRNGWEIVDAKEQKPAWSEEDEGFLNLLIAIFTNEHPNGVFTTNNITVFKGNYVPSKRIIAWLKSLRPQTTWKPSDEQMEALDDVIDEYDGYPEFDSLVSLKNDLKKLREK